MPPSRLLPFVIMKCIHHLTYPFPPVALHLDEWAARGSNQFGEPLVHLETHLRAVAQGVGVIELHAFRACDHVEIGKAGRSERSEC